MVVLRGSFLIFQSSYLLNIDWNSFYFPTSLENTVIFKIIFELFWCVNWVLKWIYKGLARNSISWIYQFLCTMIVYSFSLIFRFWISFFRLFNTIAKPPFPFLQRSGYSNHRWGPWIRGRVKWNRGHWGWSIGWSRPNSSCCCGCHCWSNNSTHHLRPSSVAFYSFQLWKVSGYAHECASW